VVKSSSKSAEEERKFQKGKIAAGVKLIIEGLGLDLDDENLVDTPKRVARAYREFCKGLYNADRSAQEILGKHFSSDHDDMVFVGPIHSVGICPHHLLPVEMNSYMAYIPKQFVVGLSKLSRFVKLLSARPVLQEDLTREIADGFMSYVEPEGVSLLVEARHGCMAHRGVNEPLSSVDTIAVRGVFRDDPSIKQEFFNAVERRR
jgi:GTP cyclohydrolase I